MTSVSCVHHRIDTQPLSHAICLRGSLDVIASVRWRAIALWHPDDKPLQTRNPQMKTPTRRRFIEITPFAGLALLAACSPKVEPQSAPVATAPNPSPAPAAAPAPSKMTTNLPMVEKGDAQAVVFGYVDDATQADKVKFKNHVSGSACSNCALYQGKAGDVAGGCPLFAGKNVAAKGWCTSWAKKA